MNVSLDEIYKITDTDAENEQDIWYRLNTYTKQKLIDIWSDKNEIKHYIG